MVIENESSHSGTSIRLHSLDGLRASMMLLGLVLHCACNYQSTPQDMSWNFRDAQTSEFFTILVGFIHAWRMPIFMFIGGFFGALLVEKRGPSRFIKNRLIRLGAPLLLFLPILLPVTVAGFQFANISKNMGSEAAWKILGNSPLENLFIPITIHLWFIYYLLIYSICGFVFIQLTKFLPDFLKPSQILARVISYPGSSLILAVPLAFALTNSAIPGLLMVGVEFIPEPSSFLTYGFVYLCGWSLWSRRKLLEEAATWPRVSFSLTALVFLFFGWAGMINNPETYTDNAYRFIASLFSAWMIWLAIWGFIGLFAKLTAKETPIVRYLVDASYWLYILHLPFTIWIPGYLANQEWNSFTKFGITLFLTSLIGLLSYDLFVRPTWLGALLNGRRYPRALLQALSNKPFSKPE